MNDDTSRPRWPSGFRGALNVSIDVDDVDGEINHHGADDDYWRAQTEYDLHTGVWRLLDLLRDIDTQATFCWVGRCVADRLDAVEQAQADGHASAIHSWDHHYYTAMSAAEQLDDAGHKTPAWRFHDDTAGVMQQLGLLWMMDRAQGDLQWIERPDPAGSPLAQLPPSRFYDDYTYFIDRTVTPRHTAEFWVEDLDAIVERGSVMCLTLHPFVSGRPGPSRALQRLLDHAVSRGDVWIARRSDRELLA